MTLGDNLGFGFLQDFHIRVKFELTSHLVAVKYQKDPFGQNVKNDVTVRTVFESPNSYLQLRTDE